MTEDDVRQMLRKRFARRGAQFDWAKEKGVSQSYVSEFLSGKRSIGPILLRALGLEAVYRPIRKRACNQARKRA